MVLLIDDGDSGDAFGPTNGPSDSVRTLSRGMALTSRRPDWEFSMAEFIENMRPASIARSSSRGVPVNQCMMTVPGKRRPIAAMTSTHGATLAEHRLEHVALTFAEADVVRRVIEADLADETCRREQLAKASNLVAVRGDELGV